MFKKRNLKGSNFAQDMGAVGSTSGPRLASEDNEEEPVVQKKVKTTTGAKHSTKELTNEYGRMANEYTDELKFKSSSELLTKDSGNAVAGREVDTDEAHDSRAVKLRQIQHSKDIKAGKVDKKMYTGESGYAIYVEKSEKDISNSKFTGSMGPIRAPSNIRATVRFDYNPSLCKDWHDTGYCGFGDSCIYIHDRGDYKSGWEMEKEWEQEQAENAKRFSVNASGAHIHDDEEEQEEDDGIPRKCQICEEEFRSPVVTTCKHYFCEKCAFESYRRSKTCPVCSRPMNGIFNVAKDVIARDKAEGNKTNNKGPEKRERIVLNQKEEGEERPVRRPKGAEEGGLDGVEFAEDEEDKEEEDQAEKEHKHTHKHKHGKKDEEEDFEKIANEFRSEVQNQKKFRIQSDWLY